MNTAFIKSKMGSLNLDADQLAKRCFITKKYMEQIINNGTIPSKRVRGLMAQTLGCEPSDLIYREARAAV